MSSITDMTYYELGWSILSTIGMANFLCGMVIVGITSFSDVAAVPIITSAACAIANGLCYYAFYHPGVPLLNRAIGSIFADVFWLVQEAGLSFYSYAILSRVLRARSRYIFISGFWVLIIGITASRVVIAVMRARSILTENESLQDVINALHITYFTLIALVECFSAFFLLRMFSSAENTSIKAAVQTGLFRYLMRSTEVRLAFLAIVGVMRAVTYSSQSTAQAATTVASQVDRFAYTMECMFPVIMYIDILASKLASVNYQYDMSSRNRHQPKNYARQYSSRRGQESGFALSSIHGEHIVEVQGGRRASSQAHIIETGSASSPTSDFIEPDNPQHKGGISKTVEIEVNNTSIARGW